MKKLSIDKSQLLKKINGQLETGLNKIGAEKMIANRDEYLNVKVKNDQSRLARNSSKMEKMLGKFFVQIEVMAKQEDVYIPISIASSKKPTGFIYQIEGTGESLITTADVSCQESAVTQITLGTIHYAKIPKGKTAVFRIQISLRGKNGKTYKIVINRINYKLNPSDVRYKQINTELITDSVKFSV